MMNVIQVAENHHADVYGPGSSARSVPPDAIKDESPLRPWTMPIVLLGIVILFNWKLLLTGQYTWLEDPDRTNQVLPWLQFQALQFNHWRLPAWDPNAWLGQPLFGQGQPGSANPLNWLLFLVPMKQGVIDPAALNWYYVLMRYAGVLAAYALCRDLKRSRTASVLGACVFGLGGYVGNTGWPQMVMGAILAPLVFLYLFRAERGVRPLWSAVLSGFFLGASWLSGHHQAPLYVSLAAIGTWIWVSVRGGRVHWPLLKLAAISLVIAFMAGAFQTLPMAEYGTRSVRWVGTPDPLAFDQTTPYYIHERYAPPPQALFAIFLPNLNPIWNPFIGVAAFSLALLGLICNWKQREVRWLGCIALMGMLFTLAGNSLLHGIFYTLVPMVEKARSAGAAIAVFAVGIAPLAAFGLDRIILLFKRNPEDEHRVAESSDTPQSRPFVSVALLRAIWVLAAFGALLLLGIALVVSFGPNPPVFDTRLVVTAVCAMAVSALFAAIRGGALSPQGGGIGLVLIVLFELANVTNFNLTQFGPNRERTPLLNNLTKHNDIAQFFSERHDFGRIEYQFSDIPYNFGDYFNLPAFTSYTASMTSNVWRNEIFKPEIRDIFGVRYSIAKQPQRPDQKLVFQGVSGLKVFENPSAYPRVWTVHKTRRVSSGSEASALLASGNFNARETALFAANAALAIPDCPDAAADRSSISGYGANRVTISAELACPGLVILSDTFYPGWRATVDGKSVPIEEVDGVFRGVMVDAGSHTIEMRYRPMTVIGGGLLTGLAAILAAIAWIRSPRYGTKDVL